MTIRQDIDKYVDPHFRLPKPISIFSGYGFWFLIPIFDKYRVYPYTSYNKKNLKINFKKKKLNNNI